jgi:cysteine desulfurase
MVAEAIEAMTRELTRTGNASSLHGSGRDARRVVEESRELIAARVGARPAEIIFTSGGTEADNLAIKGTFWSARRSDSHRRGLVSSAIEHHAVLDSLIWLESEGADVTLVPVDPTGRVNLAALAEAISANSALVTVMWANNEVGTVQPLSEVVALAAEHGVPVHSDAVQAVGHVPVDFAASGLALLSFTAHKLGGPYGIGALLARRDTALTATQHGGGQERDVRSGTLDVAAVAGFAAAVEVAAKRLATEEDRVGRLRAELIRAVQAAVPHCVLNGPLDDQVLPGVANLTFAGCDADAVLMLLDAAGIDCSTGSACSAGVSQPSHVLMAMGRTGREVRSSLRFSLGHTSTAADVAALVTALPEAVRRAKAAFT